ncbi:hypothetical protein ACCC99_02985 [Paenarthrobacter nicotinovorans]
MQQRTCPSLHLRRQVHEMQHGSILDMLATFAAAYERGILRRR